MSFGNATSQTKAETLNDLIRVLPLLPRGHFLLRSNRLIGFDLGHMRALPGYIVPSAAGSFSRSLVKSCASCAPRETAT